MQLVNINMVSLSGESTARKLLEALTEGMIAIDNTCGVNIAYSNYAKAFDSENHHETQTMPQANSSWHTRQSAEIATMIIAVYDVLNAKFEAISFFYIKNCSFYATFVKKRHLQVAEKKKLH